MTATPHDLQLLLAEEPFVRALATRLVVDEADGGGKTPWCQVRCEAEGAGPLWSWNTFTDGGRFLVPDCPRGRRLLVKVSAAGHLPLQASGVDPLAGEVELHLQRDTSPRAHIVGRLLRPDGSAARGQAVEAHRREPQEYASAEIESADGAFSLEVSPGAWWLRVEVQDFPRMAVAARALHPGETWDLGVLQLARGGTLVVHDGGDAKLDYLVLDARECFVCGLHTPVPPLRSELLAPGDYLLLVRANGIAAQAVPFTIRAEAETELAVHPRAGVRQRLEFMAASGEELPRTCAFEVRRAGTALLWHWADERSGDRLQGEVSLAPGDYTLATRAREPASTCSFTVGTEESAPVVVTLR